MTRRAINFIFIILLPAFLLSGCAIYGDNILTQSSTLSDVICEEEPTQIYLFFAGENIDFKYQKIALIEAVGNEYSSNEKILDHLKYEAWRNCANAIINIENNFKERTTGLSLNDSSEDVYSVPVFTGIAVKIEKDSAFISSHGNAIDTSFVAQVRADHAAKVQQASTQNIAILVIIALGVFVLLASLAGT